MVFQTWRQGNAIYTLPVTPGNYTVTLSFEETYYSNPGQRMFHLDIGDITVSGIDIVSVKSPAPSGRRRGAISEIPQGQQKRHPLKHRSA